MSSSSFPTPPGETSTVASGRSSRSLRDSRLRGEDDDDDWDVSPPGLPLRPTRGTKPRNTHGTRTAPGAFRVHHEEEEEEDEDDEEEYDDDFDIADDKTVLVKKTRNPDIEQHSIGSRSSTSTLSHYHYRLEKQKQHWSALEQQKLSATASAGRDRRTLTMNNDSVSSSVRQFPNFISSLDLNRHRPGAHAIGNNGNNSSDNMMYDDDGASIATPPSTTAEEESSNIISATLVSDQLLEEQLNEALQRKLNKVKRTLVAAEVVVAEDEKRSKLCLCSSVLLLVLVIAGVTIAVTVVVWHPRGTVGSANPGKATNTTMVPITMVPTMSPTTILHKTLEEALAPISQISTLRDPLTPQYDALQWLMTAESPAFIESLTTEELHERFILATFYFSTNGDRWKQRVSFLSEGVSVCDWNDTVDRKGFGVFCGANRMVSEIAMNGGDLAGSLPYEFGYLKHVELVDLSRNSIEGPLPESIGNMESLSELEVYSNLLTGTLPTTIGKLQNLTTLDLEGNKFEGTVPTEIGRIRNLESLYLSRNYGFIGKVPTEIGLLTNLELADFGYNQLSGTIPQLINLSQLTALGFFNNNLKGNIGDMLDVMPESLVLLLLAFNDFTGTLPSTISRFVAITDLNLRYNSISGTLPTEISDLKSMNQLDLFNNKFTGTLPSEIGSLRELELLNLGTNYFSGTVPKVFSRLRALREVDLAENNLEGSPGPALTPIGTLETVSLQNNPWTELNTVCVRFPRIPHVNGNSCEEPDRFDCPCCTFCCNTPPYAQQQCQGV